MRKQRGITLISLVVTIIVLIILAGVSINAFLGEDGVITIARQAKENMQLAQMEEQTKLNELYTQIGADGGLLGGTSYDAIAKLAEFKRIIAEAITNKGVPTSETDSAQKMAANIARIGQEGISIANLEVGDYIKYNTGVTSVGENGVIMCRVLYNDATNGLQIISNTDIADVTLGGSDCETARASYNSAIEDLNDEAEKYLNTAYAYDARCVGSLPTIDSNGYFSEKDKGTETTVVLPLSDWSTSSSSSSSSSSTEWYDTDTNYTADEKAIHTIGRSMWSERSYWLASRHIYSTSYSCSFDVRNIDKYGTTSTYLCVAYDDSTFVCTSHSYGLRPCFSLKSDIKISGEDGKTADTAYIIQ